MDDTTNTNQNIQQQPSMATQPAVTTVNPLSSSNPYLDKLDLGKYDNLLANFELKNPDLANKAKSILAGNVQTVVTPEVSQVPPVEELPQNVVQVPVPEPIQEVATVEPSLPVSQVPQVNNDQVVDQASLKQVPTIVPVQAPVPQLDPTILTQSFQQFPKGSENNQASGKPGPEYQSQSNESGNESKVEAIVEELKSIEKSPEETNEKVKEDPKPKNPNENNNQDVPKVNAPQVNKIKVYGYQIPQKILELGSKVNELASRGDLGSAKTWLYILVGRVIATKKASESGEDDGE
ncbi:MAG: hypothetical protein WCO33_02830 [bacterium]